MEKGEGGCEKRGEKQEAKAIWSWSEKMYDVEAKR